MFWFEPNSDSKILNAGGKILFNEKSTRATSKDGCYCGVAANRFGVILNRTVEVPFLDVNVSAIIIRDHHTGIDSNRFREILNCSIEIIFF